MAECNVSIDQKNLPGVKEVCRDFAVLEDHSLAYNLQEQEIESHLASNVHKSRLVQQDLQVAKRLQEEEDLRAKAQSRRLQTDIERQDTEIAHEIQEELVRQAEQQRQQEEKDAAIARKLHEKEIKEERKRQKQLETNFDDEYFEDQGGHVLHKGSGEVVAETDYRLTEATKGLTKLDIHEQELKDREVARKLQEEELKTNSTISRAAQVAQDEEIARLLMEQEKKEYKKQREREKERQREKERERDRMAVERKRHEAEYRPNSEEVVRPRTRDEYEYQRQKNHNKPVRPPQPRPHEYANVNPAYSYPDQPLPPRAPTRPEPTSRGAYYKR
ncbi:coiled-coil domain-containing protein 50 isoform X2 [Periophthalmus magnuspinnatus]|uniref:coiled-coil domain-containing protein 50 isoform X2 n=1 Tax=Periophthalmus magnuspinnatus TaxID=409849 RepID=UPI00145B8712|nr:coiled-coil domain-containing protein 50 isoform X2 [Periophthalmus magnuspinnatus]